MALRINTNTTAMNAQRNLGINNNLLAKSLERLSSGRRINRAADDAAGLAISETLKAQIGGMGAAVSNALDSINLIQTAEGGLEQSTAILHRMRELAVQASNDTYTQSDREKIQEEVSQLQSELSRISGTTQFNGRNLLDGSIAQSSALQDGAIAIKSNARVGTGTSFGDLISSAVITNPTTASTDASVELKVIAGLTVGQFDLEVRASDGFFSLVSNVGAAAGGTRNFTLTSGAGVQINFGAVAVATTDVGDVATVQVTSRKAAVTIDNALTFHIGQNEGQIVKAGFANMSATALKLEGVGVLGTTDADSRVKSQNLIGVVDEALKTVNTQRARMGAMQNRLEFTIANLQIASENLSSANSRIADVDVAKESSFLTRQQILVQAGTAILSQANANPSNALSLLR